MTYLNVSVPRKHNAGMGIQAKDKITLVDAEDIQFMPPRDENGVLLSGNIVLKSGAYAISVYATPDKIKLGSKSEGETDNEGFVQSLTFSHPGNEREIREFKANWLGRKVVAIISYCCKDHVDILGSDLCNPLKMQVDMNSDKEGTANEFSFESVGKGNDIAMYQGTIPGEDPVAVVAAAASVTIPLSGSGQYQLTAHSTASKVEGCTGATHGLVFTLLGVTSGTAPTIDPGEVFVLRDGTAWSAGSGRTITLRAFKTGASSYKFIEISRS